MKPEDVINIPTMDEFNALLNSLNLSDRQREIFVYKYSRLWRNIDIAEELQINQDTVSADIKVIREKLKAISNYKPGIDNQI